MKKILILFLVILLAGCDQAINITKDPEPSPPSPYVYLEEGNDIITVGDGYSTKRCYYVDSNEIEHKMKVVSNTLDRFTLGEYLITYEYTDTIGTHTCQRKLFVVDNIAPLVQLNPGVDTVKQNTEHVDQGVTYTDNYSLLLSLETKGTVDTTTLGVYEIKYIVTDEFDNKTVTIRYVTVIE